MYMNYILKSSKSVTLSHRLAVQEALFIIKFYCDYGTRNCIILL